MKGAAWGASVVLALFLAAGTGFAQTDTTKVEQERQTSHVILDHDDFVKYNCENVGDALRTITGVYVNAQGEVMLRDVSSSKVVVIMDGQKLNVPGGIGVNVSNISIENIETIELLRGGRSAEYGSDAVGGVIVINSKKRQDQGLAKRQPVVVRASYGSYNRQIYSVNHSMNLGNVNTMLSYRRDLWDGNFEYTDLYGVSKEMVNNEQSTHSVFAKVGWNIDETQSLQSSYSLYTAENGSPGMIDRINPEARIRFNNHTLNLNYRKQKLFKDFDLDASGYYLNFRTRFDDDYGSIVPVHSDHKNYAVGTDLKQTGNFADWLRVSYGYSFRNDRINSTDVGKRERDTHSGFATFSLDRSPGGIISTWSTALALRYDAPSDFNSELSPRLSVSVTNQSRLTTTLAAHLARSYRAPTFNDLYWPQDAFAIGNPDLKPEYGTNYDVGLNFQLPCGRHNVNAAVNYFRNDVTDLILWAQSGPNNLWTPNNISETQTWGVETSGTISLFDGLFTTNTEYTYMEALDKGPDPNRHDKYIIYRPKNKLSLTGTLKYQSLEWSMTYEYTGLRYTNPANTKYLPEYSKIDGKVSYGFTLFRLRSRVAVETTNLTDEDFMKVYGTAEPGRQYKFTLWLYL
ncbi:MAG TPA: TonB-dependent receptor [Bacteroidetes bacterium]|nr:TonB-dependent receptor [Bacteroidota bacterium]